MLKKHKLQSNHPTVTALKIDRIEICRFCSEDLNGSNRVCHEKAKQPKDLEAMKRAAVKVASLERTKIFQVIFFTISFDPYLLGIGVNLRE